MIFRLGLENHVLLVQNGLFFDETPKGKYEAETISMDYIIFSDFKNYSSLYGVKWQLAWAKRPNTAWKRVKQKKFKKISIFFFFTISVADPDPVGSRPLKFHHRIRIQLW
jgi:hypothetical protein